MVSIKPVKICAGIGAAAFSIALTIGVASAEQPGKGLGQRIADRVSEGLEALDGLPPSQAKAPRFRVVPGWPKPLPNNWQIGQVAGIAVDTNDNIWVLHRPRSLSDDEAWATDAQPGTFVCNAGGIAVDEGDSCAPGDDFAAPVAADAFGHPRPDGPVADCCIPAPSVLQFDADGNLLRAWGGPVQRDDAWGWPEAGCLPGEGCEWPANEHGIYVDENLNVYIGGNGFGDGTLGSANNDRGWDGQILKFSADGTFLLQVGEAGTTGPTSNDTDGANGTPRLWRPADSEVFNGDLYIADGYGNHRIVVVDANTGEYKRHWGAYGSRPVDDAAANAAGPYTNDRDAVLEGTDTPDYFRNPVHCVRIANDGRTYVCDRVNDRIQVFDQTAGTQDCSNTFKDESECGFLTEKFLRADTLGPGSVWDLDTSSDREQSCLHNVDGTNQHLDTLYRASLEVLDTVGMNGRNAGDFHWVHNLAVDSHGNIYTAEVDTGKRAQKFRRVGRRGCRG